MRLKTFSAPTMAEVLDQIRKELGLDAVIVSTQHEGRMVQVTAAVEAEAPSVAPLSRSLLEHSSQDLYSPLQIMEIFCRCLEYHVVPPALTETFLGKLRHLIQTRTEHTIESVMEQLIPHAPLSFKKPSILVLEGPPGAGKSMTAAKIASEFVLAGLHPIVITLDTLKAGAIEQLLTYTKALKVSFLPFKSHFEVVNYLRERDPAKPVIIDTPGINPLNSLEATMVRELSQLLNLKSILVYPAGTDPYELQDRFQADSAQNHLSSVPHPIILTRCDAVSRFGTLLAAVAQKGFELSHMSMGPELGNRLRPATPESIFKVLMAPLKTQGAGADSPLFQQEIAL